jgi:hypothetical protein
MKAYTTTRKGNDGRTYVGANINNRQFEVKVPSANKIMNKVLDSKVSKKVIIPVGNMVIKAVKTPGKMVSRAIKIESDNAKRKDNYYRANAPVGAYGGTNTGAVKFPTKFKK